MRAKKRQSKFFQLIKYKLGGFLLYHFRKHGKSPDQLMKEICLKLQVRGTFLDIGANIGLITNLVLNKTPENIEIISVEPDPIAFQSLSKNVCKNRVKLINAAAWTSSTQLPLFRSVSPIGEVITTSSSLNFSKNNIQVSKFEIVQTIDICKVIEKINVTPIIIKIDIEGAEYELINHMIKKGCIKKVEKIYCEFHFNSIRFGYTKHAYLFAKLLITGNFSRIKSWF